MEYTKDDIFNIRYNTELNRLEMRKKNKSVLETVKKHKLISFVITTLIVFSCLNFFLIYNFMKILQNIWNIEINEV